MSVQDVGGLEDTGCRIEEGDRIVKNKISERGMIKGY